MLALVKPRCLDSIQPSVPWLPTRLTLSQTVNFARIARRYPARIERFLDDPFVDLFQCFNNPLSLQDLNIETITCSQ